MTLSAGLTLAISRKERLRSEEKGMWVARNHLWHVDRALSDVVFLVLNADTI